MSLKMIFTKLLKNANYFCYRPLLAANFSDNLLTVFVLHILSVPAIIHHVAVLAPDVSSSSSTILFFC